MSELPHGLTEALHYLDPWPWRRLALGAATGLALALWGWWQFRRRSSSGAARAAPRPSPPPPAAEGIGAELDRLGRRHLVRRSYRAGCHELSAVLRRHLEGKRGRPYSRWTAREVERADGDTVWARLLALLTDLQFSRRPPGRSDFEGALELARDAVTAEGRG